MGEIIGTVLSLGWKLAMLATDVIVRGAGVVGSMGS